MRALAFLPLAALCAAQTPLRLPNGLNALLLEQHESSLLRVEVRIPIAPADLPPGKPGLPELFLRVLQAGFLGRRAPEAYAAALEQNGLRLGMRVDHGGLRLSLLARSSDQELAFSLLADLLLRASLENGPLEMQRQRLFKDTASRSAADLDLARLRAQQGPEAPPTEASLASFRLEDLMDLRARILRPERVRMAIAGDLTPSQVRRALLLSLGTWAPGPAPAAFPDATPVSVAAGGARALPLPAPPMRPLLGPLLREALPKLSGSGAPGDPWIHPEPAEEALQKAAAQPPRAQDLARVKAAWSASMALRALDPDARLEEALEPGPSRTAVQAATLDGLHTAWRDLLNHTFTPNRDAKSK